MWRDTEGLILLFWSILFVGERVVRWESGKGGRVLRWQGGKGGRYLVLFKGMGLKMSPRFHLFVSDFNQGNKGAEQRFSCMAAKMKDSP